MFCSSVPRRSFPFAAGVDFSPRELCCPACCVHGTERSLAGGVSSGLLAMLSSTPVWDRGAVFWMLPMQALLAHVMFSLFCQARFCFLNVVLLGSILSLLIVFLQDPEKLYKSVMQRRFPMSTCSLWCPEPDGALPQPHTHILCKEGWGRAGILSDISRGKRAPPAPVPATWPGAARLGMCE